MKKQIIRITENDIHTMVENTLMRVLEEQYINEQIDWAKVKDYVKKAGLSLATVCAILYGANNMSQQGYDEIDGVNSEYQYGNGENSDWEAEMNFNNANGLNEDKLYNLIGKTLRESLNKIK